MTECAFGIEIYRQGEKSLNCIEIHRPYARNYQEYFLSPYPDPLYKNGDSKK